MNYKLAQICIILSALSVMTITGIYAYKTFYYDPKNEWKLISDVKNHVYIVKNRGEDICHYSGLPSVKTYSHFNEGFIDGDWEIDRYWDDAEGDER